MIIIIVNLFISFHFFFIFIFFFFNFFFQNNDKFTESGEFPSSFWKVREELLGLVVMIFILRHCKRNAWEANMMDISIVKLQVRNLSESS